MSKKISLAWRLYHAYSYGFTATRSMSGPEKPVIVLAHNFFGEELEEGEGSDGEGYPIDGGIHRDFQKWEDDGHQRRYLGQRFWEKQDRQQQPHRTQVRCFAHHVHPLIVQDGPHQLGGLEEVKDQVCSLEFAACLLLLFGDRKSVV